MSDMPAAPQTESAFTAALGEVRAHLARPGVLVSMAAAGTVLGIAGPFGSEGSMAIAPRLAFWLLVVFTTYPLGALATWWVELGLRRLPRLSRAALAGCAAAMTITPYIMALNTLMFPDEFLPLSRAFDLWFSIAAICMVICLAFVLLGMPARFGRAAPPPLIDRLPEEKRGALVSLSVEDHHVRVRTTLGEELLLMRLSDAIRETGEIRGMQTHRSHWVALDHVGGVIRDGARATLRMAHGPDIPVSRAKLPVLLETGLLPGAR